jgi:acetylornithine deacetylase/succinyl-diaminopimelate desuccinylase-like protein
MTITYDDEVSLAQALIRASSPSGHESAASRSLLEAFHGLRFDEARIDAVGNAVGIFRRGSGPAITLCGHLDTVPAGDPSLWPHPPLSGAVAGGNLWGRGACDMKGALAAMTIAASDAVEAGFSGTLQVSGVVQEEVGGLGARHLARGERADAVILGEPSELRLMLGHRGRVELEVRVPGKIAHAARSELGENALNRAADLLGRLQQLELPSGGPLGSSTLTPTRLISFPPDGANVVPGRADLTIDYRNIPGDTPEQILGRVQQLAPDAKVRIPTARVASESGEVVEDVTRIVEPYLMPADHPVVERARVLLAGVLAGEGIDLEQGYWWFATDAPELASMSEVVIGFGPGEQALAHTTRERVPLRHLAIARAAYRELVLGL